jgi:hypothetical protein
MSDPSHGKPHEGSSYSGEVWTDGEGRAVIVLPPSVRAHNGGFDYALTPDGSRCSALGVEMTADDRFTIATDEPHVKVAWRITARREAPS